jgi:MFS family permease
LIRRFRHIRVYAAMAAIGSSSALVHGLIVTAYVRGVLRIITGICMVGLYMVIESWLNEDSPQPVWGQAFAAYAMLTLLAMAAGKFSIVAGDVDSLALFAASSSCFR